MTLSFKGINRTRLLDKLAPPSVCDRTGDYDIRDDIRDKWVTVDPDVEDCRTCAHLSSHFVLSDDEEKGIVIDDIGDYKKSFGLCISSSMLLYRCCCTFPDNIRVQDYYKDIWSCWLRHKESKNILLLSEWKGTPHIGLDSKFRTIKDLPKEFSDDIMELLNYLLSDQCVHPYDNTVAGTQA